MVKFVLGQELKCVNAHSGILSRLSSPIKAALTGGMQESQTYVLEWPDVEFDVFSAMYEFAFTGDYVTPKDHKGQSEYIEALIGPEEASYSFSKLEISKADKPSAVRNHKEVQGADYKRHSTDALRNASSEGMPSSESLRKVNPPNTTPNPEAPRPLSNLFAHEKSKLSTRSARESMLWSTFFSMHHHSKILGAHRQEYHRNLLFHAKVYCLAESKLIESLKNISLRHLHEDLLEVTGDFFNTDLFRTSEAPGEVLELAAFVYLNTYRYSSSGHDMLRRMVSTYIAAQAKELERFEEFRPLLDACAELASDLVHLML